MVTPSLKSKIRKRFLARCYPFVSDWRLFPVEAGRVRANSEYLERMSALLETMHILSIDAERVLIDGRMIKNAMPRKKKVALTEDAIESVFGPVVDTNLLNPPYALEKRGSGFTVIKNEQDNINYFFICLPKNDDAAFLMGVKMPPIESAMSFAYRNLQYTPYPIPLIRTYEDAYAVELVGVIDGKEAFKTYASWKFFQNPAPRNAIFFGDLLLLTQARAKWRVAKLVNPLLYNKEEKNELIRELALRSESELNVELCKILKHCVGVESLKAHGHVEILMGDEKDTLHQRWQALLHRLAPYITKSEG
jgi:hypothetical protein